jgi:hypothetical protein
MTAYVRGERLAERPGSVHIMSAVPTTAENDMGRKPVDAGTYGEEEQRQPGFRHRTTTAYEQGRKVRELWNTRTAEQIAKELGMSIGDVYAARPRTPPP